MEQVGTVTAIAGSDREASDDPLRWLSTILWPDGEARLLVDRRRHRPGADRPYIVAAGDGSPEVGCRWWASPGPHAAEVLIPATSAGAARAAVRRYHDGLPLGRRVRNWAAELVMGSPALAAKLLDRRLVAAAGRLDEGLLSELAAAVAGPISIDEVHVAMSLARPKSNRKPVLQLLDQHGDCLGWAKIGWNDWTRQLVANEADWLDRPGVGPITTPRVLDRLTLGGHLVVVTSGVVGSRRPRLHPHRPPPPGVFLAVADRGTRTAVPVVETAWWRSVDHVIDHATAREARAVDQIASAVGSAPVEIGAWHGDLTPWNIVTGPTYGPSRGPIQVIDWEFAADEVPLGFDLCHFHTQVGAEMLGLTTRDALDRSARLSPQGLARLGVDPHNQLNVYRLYLVELIRRTLALRAGAMPVDRVEQGEAAVDRILTGPTESQPPT